jgi:Fe2+ transport system protein B
MLPLVQGKPGAVVVTFWDKVQPGEAAQEALERLSSEAGVPFVAVNARQLTDDDRSRIEQAILSRSQFGKAQLRTLAGWRIEPRPGWLEKPILGPSLAVLLLIVPALATIFGANAIADRLNPIVQRVIAPWIETVNTQWPNWTRVVLTAQQGDFGYGLLNMGPFLLVWALPTVLLFAVILGAYKSSGLVERINVSLHPLVRPLGLSGRDVVRIVMGFGCNVPAVISTRACSSCSRGSAIAGIAFGAACSYQLPATMAVLAAAAQETGVSSVGLTLGYLAYLFATTLIYLRLTSSPEARSSLNLLMTPSRPFMQWPSARSLWREAWGTLQQFLRQALPIFVVICLVAAVLASSGVLSVCSKVLGPAMTIFNLPADAALPVVMASIRKDGIFLFAAEDGLSTPMTAIQVLTAVYLAGVLFPCLVTAYTIGRETSWGRMTGLLLRQAAFASLFALMLAWGGRLVL